MATMPGKDIAAPSISAAGTVQIVGDQANGCVILDTQAGTVRQFDTRLNQLGAPRMLPKLTQATGGPAPAHADGQSNLIGHGTAPALRQGIAGNAATGVVYFIGNQMAYLADVGNPMSRWKTVHDLPFNPGTNILGISGDLANGIVVHNGELLALAPDVRASPAWQSNAVTTGLPILAISGDCNNGVVVYWDVSQALTDDEGGKTVLPSTYQYAGRIQGACVPMQEPPVNIDLLVGNGTCGYVALGENQLYGFDQAQGWTRKASLRFAPTGLTGNPKDGVLALVGTDNFIVSTTDFIAWTLLQSATPVIPPPSPGSSGAAHQMLADGASDPPEGACSHHAAQTPITTEP